MRLPRPSAPLVVSFLALFVALGGVSWAAIHLPPNSVGNAQLQPGSVGNAKLRPFSVGAQKIIPGAVGARQVNSSQVQLRVTGPCNDGAVQSIALSGNVTCTPVLPNEYGGSVQSVTLGSGPTPLVSKSLPGGSSYLVLAYLYVAVTGSPTNTQRVEVDCTLSASGTQSITEDLAVNLSTDSHGLAGSIPLALPVASSAGAQAATVTCQDQWTPSTPTPTVTVGTTINAIQTASNS